MIHRLLSALQQQTGDIPFEVIVADRCKDGTAERIRRDYPEVQVLRAKWRATLPELRTMALDRAQGRIILVTEDHTVPPPHWIERPTRALDQAPKRVAAVGGAVDNAMGDRAVDWAAFLCEYSAHLPPQPAGEVNDIPGMNIAYRKEVLDRMDRRSLKRGFWESTVHPRLLAEGYVFLSLPDVVIQHRKRFGFMYFIKQRFHYSRHCAGTRLESMTRGRRCAFAALSLLALPGVALLRITRQVIPRPPYRVAFARALPALICFVIAWGVGEATGYLFGPGDSLVEIE